jgi:hypothetical protein
VLHNGVGEYPAALDAAARACDTDELPHSNSALPELIEAAVRVGRPERAAAALQELDSRARASGTEWALGLAARSRALMSTGPDAEKHYKGSCPCHVKTVLDVPGGQGVAGSHPVVPTVDQRAVPLTRGRPFRVPPAGTCSDSTPATSPYRHRVGASVILEPRWVTD